jgi:translation initiation factor 5A
MPPDRSGAARGVSMAWTQQEVRELKEGRYMIIDEEPCRILSIQMSKPGKHGEAKARIDAVGLFDERKRSVVFPVTHKVQVPLIGKRQAQVVSLSGAEAQLMDLETYEMFSMAVDDELKGQLSPGSEVQYVDAMGKRRITRT